MESVGLFWSPDHLTDDTVHMLLSSLKDITWQKQLMVRQVNSQLEQSVRKVRYTDKNKFS